MFFLSLVTNKLSNNFKIALIARKNATLISYKLKKLHVIDGARTRDLRFIGHKNYDWTRYLCLRSILTNNRISHASKPFG